MTLISIVFSFSISISALSAHLIAPSIILLSLWKLFETLVFFLRSFLKRKSYVSKALRLKNHLHELISFFMCAFYLVLFSFLFLS